MQIKKVAAISLAAVTIGATLGTYASGAISDYVTHTDGTLTSPMVVIGSSAGDAVNYPKDVVAAADLAAHIAGYATTPVTATGTSKTLSITGEGKEVSTANTKLYLDDSLGKSGVRGTMTGDDLPTLLATGTFTDKNSTAIKYDQYLFLTPSSTTSASYTLQFERPSSSSSDDGMYSFGRFTTSPDSTNFFINYRVNFRKGVDASAIIGKTITLAGDTYTVLSESTSSGSTPKLVATKAAAAQSLFVSDGEVDVVVGSTTHRVRVVGTSDASTVVVAINGVSSSATKGATTNINGVDVYVDDVFHLSSSVPENNGAKLLIGAEKIIFQHNSKVKKGTNEDNTDGTFVVLNTSSNKFDTLNVYLGAPASSVTDNLKSGSKYTIPAFNKLALHFPGVSEEITADSRNVMKVIPSGDNLIQMEWTDDSSNKATISWAYKASATGTQFRLANSNGNNISVVENQNIFQDDYVVLDAGDFPHMMQLTSIDSSMLSFTLRDAFSGDSVKYDLAASDLGRKTIYIDGQAYYASLNQTGGGTTSSLNLTWGPGAATNGTVGNSITVWPTLKGKNGERVAFLNGANVTVNATNSRKIELPTGAVQITANNNGTNINVTLTAVTDEDGETSACTTSPCISQLLIGVPSVGQTNFTLGKTSTGGLNYMIAPLNANEIQLNVIGEGADSRAITQPGILIVEEKDDSSNRYSVLVTASTETSGSNSVAIPAEPEFTYDEDKQTRGSVSTIDDYVDLYGIYATRTTSGQDTLTLYYPDEQVFALVGAGSADATASIGGASGSTVDAAVVITSPVAKLANEVNTATLASDLVLVGGPCANSLVATLAEDPANGVPTCADWTLTTGLIKEVTNAFGSGKKALVVAGTNADDTRSLAAMVMTGTLSYSA